MCCEYIGHSLVNPRITWALVQTWVLLHHVDHCWTRSKKETDSVSTLMQGISNTYSIGILRILLDSDSQFRIIGNSHADTLSCTFSVPVACTWGTEIPLSSVLSAVLGLVLVTVVVSSAAARDVRLRGRRAPEFRSGRLHTQPAGCRRR